MENIHSNPDEPQDIAYGNVFWKNYKLHYSYFQESDSEIEVLLLDRIEQYCRLHKIKYLRIVSRSGYPHEHLMTEPLKKSRVKILIRKFDKARYYKYRLIRFMRFCEFTKTFFREMKYICVYVKIIQKPHPLVIARGWALMNVKIDVLNHKWKRGMKK